MHKPNRVTLIAAAVATCAATAVTVQPALAIGGCDGGASDNSLAVSGPSVRTTPYNGSVSVQGTGGGEQQQVGVERRKAFTSDFVLSDTVTSTCNGDWGPTSYVADDDYRVRATRSGTTTPSILVQIAPTISGPASQTVRKGSTYTIKGTGTPSKTLSIHFHKGGTAPTDYSIVRTVTVGIDGNWQRPYLASVDYRFYATLPNGQKSPTVLGQAR